MTGLNPHRGEVAFDLFVGKPGYENIEPGDLMFHMTNDEIARTINEVKVSRIASLGTSLRDLDPQTRQQVIQQEIAMESARDLMMKIHEGNIEASISCMLAGVKWARDKNGFKAGSAFTRNRNVFSNAPFPLGEAQLVVHEAFVWVIYGKTLAEMAVLVEKKPEGGADDGEADPSTYLGGN